MRGMVPGWRNSARQSDAWACSTTATWQASSAMTGTGSSSMHFRSGTGKGARKIFLECGLSGALRAGAGGTAELDLRFEHARAEPLCLARVPVQKSEGYLSSLQSLSAPRPVRRLRSAGRRRMRTGEAKRTHMKICSHCGAAFSGTAWTCPACHREPVSIDGMRSFLADAVLPRANYDTAYYEKLAALERSNFWFRSATG